MFTSGSGVLVGVYMYGDILGWDGLAFMDCDLSGASLLHARCCGLDKVHCAYWCIAAAIAVYGNQSKMTSVNIIWLK